MWQLSKLFVPDRRTRLTSCHEVMDQRGRFDVVVNDVAITIAKSTAEMTPPIALPLFAFFAGFAIMLGAELNATTRGDGTARVPAYCTNG